MIRNLTTLLNNLRTHNNEFKEVSRLIRYANFPYEVEVGTTITFIEGPHKGLDGVVVKKDLNNDTLVVNITDNNGESFVEEISIDYPYYEIKSKPVFLNKESIIDYIDPITKEIPEHELEKVLNKFSSKLDQMNDKEIKAFENAFADFIYHPQGDNLFYYRINTILKILTDNPEYINANVLKDNIVFKLFTFATNLDLSKLPPFSESFLIQSFQNLTIEYKHAFSYSLWYDIRTQKNKFNKLYQLYPNLIDMMTFALINDSPQAFYESDINKFYTEQPYVPGQEYLNTPKLDEENVVKLIAKKNPIYFLQNNLINKIDRHDPERYNIEYQAAFNAISLPDKELINNIEYLYNPSFENKYPLLFEKLEQKILNIPAYTFRLTDIDFLIGNGRELFDLYINNLFNQGKYYELFYELMNLLRSKTLKNDFIRLYNQLSDKEKENYKYLF